MTKVKTYLKVPLGALESEKIPQRVRVWLAMTQGPEFNFVASEKIARMIGLKGESAGANVREYRRRLVKDGLLKDMAEENGRGFKVTIQKASNTCLTALSDIGCDLFTEKQEDVVKVSKARGKLGATMKGWDLVPLRKDMKLYEFAPWAFDSYDNQFNHFWEAIRKRVKTLMNRMKNDIPARYVTAALVNHIMLRYPRRPYPKKTNSQVGWLLSIAKTIQPEWIIRGMKSFEKWVQEAEEMGIPMLRDYIDHS